MLPDGTPQSLRIGVTSPLSTLIGLTGVPVRYQDVRSDDLARQEQAVLEAHLPSHRKSNSGVPPSLDIMNIPSRDRGIDSHLAEACHWPSALTH